MPLLARDVMQTALVTVRPDETLADLESLLLRERISGVPVLDGGQLVGLVSRSDVVRALSIQRTLAEVQLETFQEAETASTAPEVEARLAERERDQAAETVARRLATLRVRDAMVHAVISVRADAPLRDVARALVGPRAHRVVVLEGQRLAGIITSLDLVGLIADGRVS